MCSQSLPALSMTSMPLSSLSDQRVPCFCAQQSGHVLSLLSERCCCWDSCGSDDADAPDESEDGGEPTAAIAPDDAVASSSTSQAVSEMRKLAVVVDESEKWRDAVSMTDCRAVSVVGDSDKHRSRLKTPARFSASAKRSTSLLAAVSSVAALDFMARMVGLLAPTATAAAAGEANTDEGVDCSNLTAHSWLASADPLGWLAAAVDSTTGADEVEAADVAADNTGRPTPDDAALPATTRNLLPFSGPEDGEEPPAGPGTKAEKPGWCSCCSGAS